MLFWMDLEMTGLDPSHDVIVEIATVATDDDLEVVAVGPQLVIHQPDAVLAAMDPVVTKMHTDSGLMEAIRASTVTLEEATSRTMAFLREQSPEPRKIPLCGNSIGTDRRFLAAHMAEVENWLHYRIVDVSTIKELVKRWYPALEYARPNKANSHRALDDVHESIAELRYYRGKIFAPPG